MVAPPAGAAPKARREGAREPRDPARERLARLRCWRRGRREGALACGLVGGDAWRS